MPHLPRAAPAIALSVPLGLVACSSTPSAPPLADEPHPIVAEYEAAYDAADLEWVQRVFTDDGVFFSVGDVRDMWHGTAWWTGNDILGPDGAEFTRRFDIHEGDDLSVTDVVQLGDHAVAFRWDWRVFAGGTGTMALRDGRIAAMVLGVAPMASEHDQIDPVLDDFRDAATAADVARLRELLTEDAVVTTAASAHEHYHRDDEPGEPLDGDGQLEAWVTDHAGEGLEVISPVQVGETIAFGWWWSGGDAGTAVLELSDGRIDVLVLTDAATAIPVVEQ